MPPYFKFLTVMAFNVFIKEKVDVAVIEVGIGGEHDCTNVLRWFIFLLNSKDRQIKMYL
jgi:folylpolyglutamate synthase